MNKNENQPLVLIVDDNSGNLQVLGNILSEKGYKIAIAESGGEALNFVSKKHPDLILLDILMPEMDGLEVCRRLKGSVETKNIPIIFISVLDNTEDKVRGFDLGGVDYITKPFEEKEVLARIQAHLTIVKQKKDIVELERIKTIAAMAATANHEINQELTVLQANLDMLEKTFSEITLSEKQIELMAKIQKPIKNITAILKKYRDRGPVRFENYSKDAMMVVFEKEEEK